MSVAVPGERNPRWYKPSFFVLVPTQEAEADALIASLLWIYVFFPADIEEKGEVSSLARIIVARIMSIAKGCALIDILAAKVETDRERLRCRATNAAALAFAVQVCEAIVAAEIQEKSHAHVPCRTTAEWIIGAISVIAASIQKHADAAMAAIAKRLET